MSAAQDTGAAVLLGAAAGQGNLASIRARAQDLRNNLAEIHQGLSHTAHLLQWEAVLEKYASLNMQAMALRDQLRGVLRQVVVHPKMVDSPDVAMVLPIQLASRITPEQEVKEAGILAAAAARMAAAGVPAENRYEVADARIEDFNNAIAQLSQPEGLLGARGTGRIAMREQSREIALALERMRAVEAATVAASEAGAQQSTGAAGALAGASVLVAGAPGSGRLRGAVAGGQAGTPAAGSTSPGGQAGSQVAGNGLSKSQRLEPVLMLLLPGESAAK